MGVLFALLAAATASFFSCSFRARRAASCRLAREGGIFRGGGMDGVCACWFCCWEIEFEGSDAVGDAVWGVALVVDGVLNWGVEVGVDVEGVVEFGLLLLLF